MTGEAEHFLQADRRQRWEQILEEHPNCGTVDIEPAAELLGLSRGAGYAAAKSGAIPTIRIGKRLLVPKRALRKLLGLDAA